jgi:hypothetical protein
VVLGTRDREATPVVGMYITVSIEPEPLEPAFDLMPATCESSSLRTLVIAALWDRIRRSVIAAVGGSCELCGRIGRRVANVRSVGQLEAHELWRYDDERRVQILEGSRLIRTCKQTPILRGRHERASRSTKRKLGLRTVCGSGGRCCGSPSDPHEHLSRANADTHKVVSAASLRTTEGLRIGLAAYGGDDVR